MCWKYLFRPSVGWKIGRKLGLTLDIRYNIVVFTYSLAADSPTKNFAESQTHAINPSCHHTDAAKNTPTHNQYIPVLIHYCAEYSPRTLFDPALKVQACPKCDTLASVR
jgi:hypothetical protein